MCLYKVLQEIPDSWKAKLNDTLAMYYEADLTQLYDLAKYVDDNSGLGINVLTTLMMTTLMMTTLMMPTLMMTTLMMPTLMTTQR